MCMTPPSARQATSAPTCSCSSRPTPRGSSTAAVRRRRRSSSPSGHTPPGKCPARTPSACPPREAGGRQSELRGALAADAEAWTSALRGCGTPMLKVEAVFQGRKKIAGDGENVVVLRAGRAFCPDSAIDDAECYSGLRAAITHLQPRADGATSEADIEVNAAQFRWTRATLRALFVHELGHVLGLDHAGRGETGKAMDPLSFQAGVTGPAEDEVKLVCDQYGGRSWLSRL